MQKLRTLFVSFLAHFVTIAKGQNIARVTFEFDNEQVLLAPLTGMRPTFGDQSCVEVDSDFSRFGPSFESRNPILLDCVCVYEGPLCTGRVQRLLSVLRAAGRRQKLRFDPRSFRECKKTRVPFSFPLRPTVIRDSFGLHDSNTCRSVQPLSQTELEDLVLVAHNQFRELHGVPNLVLNHSLSDSAQTWAETLVRTNRFSHSTSNDEYGENIARVRADNVDKEEDAVNNAMDDWYNGMDYFDFANPGFTPESYAFSQMIWRENSDMGVGIAFNNISCEYILVVHYSPGGNTDGVREFRFNVPERLEGGALLS